MSDITSILEQEWKPAALPEAIPQGDMPGDKIEISRHHIDKASVIMPELCRALKMRFSAQPQQRAVVSVFGGSGVGKSEIASLIAFYLRAMGIGSYVISGDNYPHRIPVFNDAERLRVFRCGGLRGMVSSGFTSPSYYETIRKLQAANQDSSFDTLAENPWMETYLNSGHKELSSYLGTYQEIDYCDINSILAQFHQGAQKIFLKRMGRIESDVWYDYADLHDVSVMILEWTHGGSNALHGVDYPILLNSTPEETLRHRQARGRDQGTDSPFTTMVLKIEQKLIESQADKAALIISKSGEILSYSQYKRIMAGL